MPIYEAGASLHRRLRGLLIAVAAVPLIILLAAQWHQREVMEDAASRWLAPWVDAVAADMADEVELAVAELWRRAQGGESGGGDSPFLHGGIDVPWLAMVQGDPRGGWRLLPVPGRPLPDLDLDTLRRHLTEHAASSHATDEVHLAPVPSGAGSDAPSWLLLWIRDRERIIGAVMETGRLFGPLLEGLADLRERGLGAARLRLSDDLARAIPRERCTVACAGADETDASLAGALQAIHATPSTHGAIDLTGEAGARTLVWARVELPISPATDWWIALELSPTLFSRAVAGPFEPYLVSGVLLLALAFIAAPWMTRRLMAPLHDLSRITQRAADGERIDPPAPAYREFGPLARAIRRLMEYQAGIIQLQEDLQSKLAESKRLSAYYQTLLQAVPEAVLLVDATGRISEYNQAAETLTGYRDGTLKGMSVDALVPQGARSGHATNRQRYADRPRDVKMGSLGDLKMVDAQGEEILVDVSLSPLEIEDERHVVVVIRDLRELRQAQSELRRLALVAEHTDNVVVIADARGVIEWVNPAFERTTGYAAKDAVGKKPGRLFNGPDTDREVRHRIREALEQGRPVQAELLNYKRDGSPFWVEIDIQPVRNQRGEVEHFIAIERDISERKAQEKELLESQARLAEAQRIAQIGAWELDLTTNRLHWTEETFRIFEVDPATFGGTLEDFLALVHPDDRTMVERAYSASVEQHLPYEITHRILLPDGRVKYLEEHGRTFYDEQGPVRSVGTVQDVTLRVESARLLDDKRRAEAAAEAKSAFLAAMSHEMRTPLHGVLGNLELLQRTPMQEHQTEFLRRSEDAARQLLSTIDDILDFSKIEAGRLRLERRPFPLRQTLEERLLGMVGLAQQKGVALVSDLQSDLCEWVVGDALRLQQVLANLVGNAIKFTAGRLHARVWVRLRRIDSNDDVLGFRLEVGDNGIGMMPAQQQRVFEPFAQADEATSRRFGGTGLGLAITGELVEAMGGQLEMQSEPDVGSLFTATLILPRTEICAAAPLDLAKLRIFCLIGDPEVAAITCRHLSVAGAVAERMPDLEALFEQLEKHPPDVLIVCETLVSSLPRKARGRLLAGSVSVLLLSRDPRVFREYGGAGVGFLHYPYGVDGLLEAVARQAGILSSEAGAPIPGTGSLQVPTPANDQEAEREGRLILVAEDNPINQGVIEEQLALLGYRAMVAPDGAAALALLAQRSFAAVLTDVSMPRMDGPAFIAALRGTDEGARLPVLAITADVGSDAAEACRRNGADEVLPKPLSLKALTQALGRWLLHGKDAAAPAKGEGTGTETREAVWSPDALVAIVGDDPETVSRLLARFREEYPPQLEAIVRHLTEGDFPAAAGAAHKLKSSARTVGAFALGRCCERLEKAIRSGRVLDVEAWRTGLQDERAALEQALSSNA